LKRPCHESQSKRAEESVRTARSSAEKASAGSGTNVKHKQKKDRGQRLEFRVRKFDNDLNAGKL